MKLAGKIAVVTGGGRGIGRAIAVAFAREGADVAVAARTQEEIDAAAGEIRALGRRALAVQTDVTDRDSVRAMAARVREAFGRLDVLVNNAGGSLEHGTILESDPEKWIGTIHLNVVGVYHVCQALLPLMIESGGGRIINVGSGMGHQARAGGSSYNAAKAALWMVTRCLAMEVWPHGVDVNELVPGPVATRPNVAWSQPGAPPPFADSERVKSADEVAPLAVWLAAQQPGGPTAQSFSLARRPF
ncbi:MAG: SDR family oxidoreductase [Candidatus Sumerlaeota bacterium]|nr:SDR family oxidoreductase [Candidatus Sumerlaeota bacterium]